MIIDRYLSYEILRPFSVGLGLLVIIFVGYNASVQLAQWQDDLISPNNIVILILLNTLIALEILLPSALYFAILAVISRLYKDSEIAALQAAGISELRIVESVGKIAVALALIVAVISLVARPWAYRENYRLELASITDIEPLHIEPGQFLELGNSGYVLFAGGVDRDNDLLENVFLQRIQAGQTEIIYADKARLAATTNHAPTEEADQQATFYHGHSYLLDQQGSRDISLHYKEMVLHFSQYEPDQSYRRKAQPTLNLRYSSQDKDIAEYQGRLSTPFITVVLAMLAVPLSRSGPRRSRFSAFFVAIIVYGLTFGAVTMVKGWLEKGQISPFPGLWLAGIFPLGLLIALLASSWLQRHINLIKNVLFRR